MRKQIIAPAAALLLIVMSCRQDLPMMPSPVEPASKYTVPGDQYTFYADSEKYTMTSLDRTKDYLCNFPWNVVSVVRTDNMVSVHISRPIECQVEYELIWDGTLMHSYPMMANVFINAISQNCTNKGQVGVDTLNIDLKKTFKDLSEATLITVYSSRHAVYEIQPYYQHPFSPLIGGGPKFPMGGVLVKMTLKGRSK